MTFLHFKSKLHQRKKKKTSNIYLNTPSHMIPGEDTSFKRKLWNKLKNQKTILVSKFQTNPRSQVTARQIRREFFGSSSGDESISASKPVFTKQLDNIEDIDFQDLDSRKSESDGGSKLLTPNDTTQIDQIFYLIDAQTENVDLQNSEYGGLDIWNKRRKLWTTIRCDDNKNNDIEIASRDVASGTGSDSGSTLVQPQTASSSYRKFKNILSLRSITSLKLTSTPENNNINSIKINRINNNNNNEFLISECIRIQQRIAETSLNHIPRDRYFIIYNQLINKNKKLTKNINLKAAIDVIRQGWEHYGYP